MQKIVEYSGMNNRLSPATVELLIRERSKSKSLRQLSQIFNRSHERIRQLLAKYGPPQVTLLPEERVAANLGYPSRWLTQLRKEGIINPIRSGRFWLYSEEQVSQIPSLIAEARRCQQCGKPRPAASQKFCRECSQYRGEHAYLFLSPEAKARHRERCRAWERANPERLKEIRSSTYRKERAKRFERTSYVVSGGNYLPLGTIVKVRATCGSGAVAILDSGFEIPFRYLRKVIGVV